MGPQALRRRRITTSKSLDRLLQTYHHHNLHKHPGIFDTTGDLSNAEACPALSKIVSRPEQQAMDEAICPVVGSVSSVLPPNHPSTTNAKEGDVCPVTNATLGHH